MKTNKQKYYLWIVYVLMLVLSLVSVSAQSVEIIEEDNFVYFYFKDVGNYTWTVPNGISEVDVLVVGGGGGAGGAPSNLNRIGGGGGAGGLIFIEDFEVVPNSNISIGVGAGGAGGSGAGGSANLGTSGFNSFFGDLIALGGGGGGGAGLNIVTRTGLSGGSGGGGGLYDASTGAGGFGLQPSEMGLSGDFGFGNDGISSSANSYAGGGGGAGGLGTENIGGSGMLIFGNMYAVGGSAGTGKSDGEINTGSGGSSPIPSSADGGGAGGSGIVVVRFAPLPIPVGEFNVSFFTKTINNTFVDIGDENIRITDSLNRVSSIGINDSIMLDNGVYTGVISNVSGYFDASFEFVVDNSDKVVDVFLMNALLNVDVRNAWTNVSVDVFSGWVGNSEFGFNQSFSTTSGVVSVPLLEGLDYDLFVESPIYSISEDNYKNISLNESEKNVTFYLYTENSIRVFIRDEETGDLITENISVLVNNQDFYEETFSTTTGSLFLENLTDNIYTLRFDSLIFTPRSYSVSVTEKSTQELNAYLTNSTSEVVLNILDLSSGVSIEGARVSMSRFLNGEFITVESKLSDITGRVVLIYSPDVRYRFVISKEGYRSRTFELNPILLSEYTVRLEKTESFPSIPQLFSVSVDFMPKRFVQGENNLTLFFNSPEGRFKEYGFELVYPGGSYSFNSNNAIGGTHFHTFNIENAEFLETVELTYFYQLIGSGVQSRTFNLPIIDVATPLSFADLRNNNYGLSIFEQLIIVTLTILLVGGLVLLTAGSVLGGAVVVLLIAWFGFLGFIPIWSLAIVMLAGLTYLMSKGV